MKILISGFEPFAGLKENPSEQLVQRLLNEDFPFELRGLILPVSFADSFNLLEIEIFKFSPDYVIAFGLATDRNEITPEKIAVNLMQANIPDNKGLKPQNEKIMNNSDDQLVSVLPIDNMIDAACAHKGIKSAISHSAGTYVCNYIMYNIIQFESKYGYKGGFIHIPSTAEMANNKELMTFEEIFLGVCEMLKAI